MEERQAVIPLVNKMNTVNLASHGSGGHTSKGKKVQKNSKNKHKTGVVNKSINKDRCYFCKKSGHQKKDCVKYKKLIEKNNSDNIIFIASHESNLTSVPSTTWWIDSGATVHISTTL